MMLKRKILIVETGLTSGGSWHSLHNFLLNRAEFDFEFDILTLTENNFTKSWRDSGIKVFVLHSKNFLNINSFSHKIKNKLLKWIDSTNNLNWLYIAVYKMIYINEIKYIIKLIRLYDYDLLITNVNPQRDIFAIIAAYRNKRKIISFIRSYRTKSLNKHLVKFLNHSVDSFICNSNFTKDYWRHFGLNSEKMIMIYNMFSNSDNLDQENKVLALETNDNKFKLITVANFSEAKGHKFLIDVFAEIIKRNQLIELIIVGDGPLIDEVRSQVNYIQLNRFVKFIGYDKNAKKWMANSDVIIVPSKQEAFGRIIIEAFSQKKPIIATNVGGIPELIMHRFNGMLVEYGNVENMADSIIELMNNVKLRESIAKKGYDFFLKNFSKNKQLQELKEEFKRVMGQRV